MAFCDYPQAAAATLTKRTKKRGEKGVGIL